MMALQLAIWGAWAPKLFPYMGMMGFTAGQQLTLVDYSGTPLANLVTAMTRSFVTCRSMHVPIGGNVR